MSQLGNINKNKNELPTEEETVSFKTEKYFECFKDSSEFIGEPFEKWCTFLIVENCPTNVILAIVSNKPFVECYSHKPAQFGSQ